MSALEVRDDPARRPRAERRQADRSEARLLALAVQIVHLHPVEDHTPVASWDDPLLTIPDDDDPITDHLAGTGTPQVAERAVEELAAALDLSYRSGCGLVADSLELSYRLPRLWALVQAGRVAGVEGPQGRPAHHPPRRADGRVRRRPGRDRRGEEPARAQPARSHPPGADPVRTRRGPRPRTSRPDPSGGPVRLPRRDHRLPGLGHPDRRARPRRRTRPRRRRDRPRRPPRPPRRRLDPSTSAGPAPSGCSPTPKPSSTSSPTPTCPTSATETPPRRAGPGRGWRSGPPPAPGSAPRPPRSTSTSTPTTSAATPRTATSPPARSRSSAPPASRPSPPGSAGPAASRIKPVLDMNRSDAVDAARPTSLDA